MLWNCLHDFPSFLKVLSEYYFSSPATDLHRELRWRRARKELATKWSAASDRLGGLAVPVGVKAGGQRKHNNIDATGRAELGWNRAKRGLDSQATSGIPVAVKDIVGRGNRPASSGRLAFILQAL